MSQNYWQNKVRCNLCYSFAFGFAKMALKRAIMVPVESKVIWENLVLKTQIKE
jgi:hypothetical protein